jgi:hypothetical protein
MKKQLLIISVLIGSLNLAGQVTVIDTYVFTGAPQSFTVPACVDTLYIQTWGAQGGNAVIGGTGGLGGYAKGDFLVSPGDMITIYVGGQNGYNGGGNGGKNGDIDYNGTNQGGFAGVGGGASDVRFGGVTLNDRIIVAGAGGGGGHAGVWPNCQPASPAGNGGDGGATDGGTGSSFDCNCGGGGGTGGLMGTLVAGGNAGFTNSGNCGVQSINGTNGSFGMGGNGSMGFDLGNGGGGGGGAGYYGGGAGGQGYNTTPGGGGGGGSSFTGTLLNPVTTPGLRTGNGQVVVRYFTPCPLGVEEIIAKMSMNVYPNPAGDQVTVGIIGAVVDAEVIVLNVFGATVGIYSLTEGKSEINIDTQNFSSGVYFVKLKTAYGSVTKKLVKN